MVFFAKQLTRGRSLVFDIDNDTARTLLLTD